MTEEVQIDKYTKGSVARNEDRLKAVEDAIVAIQESVENISTDMVNGFKAVDVSVDSKIDAVKASVDVVAGEVSDLKAKPEVISEESGE